MDVAVDLAVDSVYDEVADIYDAAIYRTGTERREAWRNGTKKKARF